MAEKTKPKKVQGRSPKYLVYARIDPKVGEALERYIEETRPRPDKTGIVEWALEEFLRKSGFYAPPDE